MVKWQLLSVALGGSTGALLRYAINLISARLSTSTFPAATLIANTLGCFCIGIAYIFLVDRTSNPNLRLFIITGLLGALTTFSTYSLDSLILIEKGRYTAAFVYIAGSVIVGLAAVLAGIALAKRF